MHGGLENGSDLGDQGAFRGRVRPHHGQHNACGAEESPEPARETNSLRREEPEWMPPKGPPAKGPAQTAGGGSHQGGAVEASEVLLERTERVRPERHREPFVVGRRSVV